MNDMARSNAMIINGKEGGKIIRELTGESSNFVTSLLA
jgi:hypothetical protein